MSTPRAVTSIVAAVLLGACTTSSSSAPRAEEPPAAASVTHTSVRTPRSAAERAPAAGAARAALAAALAPAAEQRWQRRRALRFADGGASFALDDAWSLLAQAPRPRRASLMASMAPALALRSSIDVEERALVDAAALGAGTSAAALVASRVGLDAPKLASLVSEVLDASGELLAPVAADATLVPDVLAPPRWWARTGGQAALSVAPSSVTQWALHYGDVPRPPSPDDAAAFARSLTVELRLAALSVQALSAPASEHDALASRALAADADAVVGAAVLLEVDHVGAVAERFVGLLRAPAVARARWSGTPLASVTERLEQAPPPDEEGYPEAYVAVARLLPDLVR